MNEKYFEIYKDLNNWIVKNDYKSYDLCDVKSTSLFLKTSGLYNSKYKLGKYVAFPFNYLIHNHSPMLRKIFNIEKNKYPQAQALIANSYLNLFKKTQDESWLIKARTILDWLIENRSKDFKNYCWGQPYDWYSRKIIKKFTPRATVSSQVAETFLDMYEITNEDKYLTISTSICEFYIEDLNWNEDKDGDICFSYTTDDNYLIHNASMLAAAVLFRTWKHTQISKFKEFGTKSCNFTIKHQNSDGSWFYWAPPDKVLGKIDHYHTGFVLESLFTIDNIINDNSVTNSFQKGVDYYNKNLFTDDLIPKYTNKSLHPIDIQSLAQAIITYAIISKKDETYIEKAKIIFDWTIENMYNPDGYFYYRIYKNGKIDKTPYIRWSESWMLRAASLII